MKQSECSFYKSMQSWKKDLDNADQKDTARIAYLTNKYKAAAAIVEQRIRLGRYDN